MIGEKIKKLRMESDMTQCELATALGVSSAYVGLWEVNKRQPDIAIVVKIAKIFNVTTDYLLGHTTENEIKIIGKNGFRKDYHVSDELLDSIHYLLESESNNNA